MDPTTCYQELVLALRREDMVEARHLACDLRDWFAKGGLRPQGVHPDEVFKTMALALDPFGNATDCGEGPWATREDAEAFAVAEVGATWNVLQCEDGLYRVFVR